MSVATLNRAAALPLPVDRARPVGLVIVSPTLFLPRATKNHVAVIDDDDHANRILEAALSQRGYRVTVFRSPEDALSWIRTEGDVVLADIDMRAMPGAALCARIASSGRDIPVVAMTAEAGMLSAIAALRAGVSDYFLKPLDPDALVITLDRCVKSRQLELDVRRLRLEGEATGAFEGMVGDSAEMKRAFALIAAVARSDTTVLVVGESGSGKELVARAIHAQSTRARGPFIAINCAAMPDLLLESELFGHVKGAFTDAHNARQGLFVKATRGTLFLDEIGEMPLSMQAKLLRALQERTVRPVGGHTEIPFDTRIVAATNRDLERAVAAKTFREDLFYRINVVQVATPPLRARERDVLILANHMLRRFQPNGQRVVGFTRAALDTLLTYTWPGNVRELQNCIEHAVALAEFDHVGVDDLPDRIRSVAERVARVAPLEAKDLITAGELENRHIAQVLRALGGNKTLAARALGFDRRTLYRKLRRTRDPELLSAAAGAEPERIEERP